MAGQGITWYAEFFWYIPAFLPCRAALVGLLIEMKSGPTSYINCNVQGENGALRSALLLDYFSGEILESGK